MLFILTMIPLHTISLSIIIPLIVIKNQKNNE